ncbi:MAG: methionyl-tRNA formyltransferase [Butyrivibrio sp.]|nr:methionyl-tRNA formyltransferase [Acetatifactor muris]MCM1558462.1 methionyl-tRNA formyltransferase [Butyrivibrio sp.]
MKIIFMGTPDFAAGALRALIAAGHDIAAVVTQPDRAKGRSGAPIPSPVKVCGLEHHIPVLQPKRVKAPETVAELKTYQADIYIVAAYGQILSQEILDLPPYGCLNIHASLLPKYRGASPIQHVIIDGEERTGITVMQMDAGLDTGAMLYKKETVIGPEDTYETLHDRLMELGGQAVTEALKLLEQGKLVPEKQDDSQSCYAPLIKKSMGEIDFSKTAEEIDRLIRGMTPWPSAYTCFRGRQLKIWKAVPDRERDVSGHVPGEILSVEKESVTTATGRGTLRLLELQLEGKKRMSAHDFLLGVRPEPGEILGAAGMQGSADSSETVRSHRPQPGGKGD